MSTRHSSLLWLVALGVSACLPGPQVAASTNWTLLAWNNLGMHCLDSDFSVFAILPPYNTLHAHLVHDGQRMDAESYITVTYEAVADPDGSINRTSAGKGNFWDHSDALFGVALTTNQGLAGARMPGSANSPQPVGYDATYQRFNAEGIPLTPYDDAGHKNYYPLFRLRAYSNETEVAHTDVVLPVSDEMDCRGCHGTGAGDAARPYAGWSWDPNPDRAYRLNILRLHDETHLGDVRYTAALSNAGYRADGLYPTVVVDGTAILCARCHASVALSANGYPGVSALTQAMHHRHANVPDPLTGLTLEDVHNRSACYRCHPGSTTLCLRGAMGKAVAADGTMALQCQSCHGSMRAVGSAGRTGWLDEPNCQSCHTGSATHNNGQIRFTDAFDTNGEVRVAVDTAFATNPNTPGPGYSLYRFSQGHGGLQCEACHGSTHAEFPSSHRNDNLQSIAVQGHAGMIVECAVCHSPVPTARFGGPHGMHPIGAAWVQSSESTDHRGAADANLAACRACHGADDRGTVLSRVQGFRSLNTSNFGAKTWWKGTQIGCYTCHNGPGSENATTDHAPVTASVAATIPVNTPKTFVLAATDVDAADTLTYRIVSQPLHGTVALNANMAIYSPFADFVGNDAFSFAAWDGKLDSNLASGVVTVVAGTCVLEASAYVPAEDPVNVPVPFWGAGVLHGCATTPDWTWSFGDGTPAVTGAVAQHAYLVPGAYDWQADIAWGRNQQSLTGQVTITATIIDEDGDGIGDEWELQNFGRLGAVSNDSDVDGDHFRDGAEYLAGTDPTNGASYLGIKALNVQTNGQTVITWQSVARRFYALDAGTSADTTVFLPVETNVPATPPVNVYTNPPDPAHGFYRVRLE